METSRDQNVYERVWDGVSQMNRYDVEYPSGVAAQKLNQF